jgi:hypothetical protein
VLVCQNPDRGEPPESYVAHECIPEGIHEHIPEVIPDNIQEGVQNEVLSIHDEMTYN